MAIREGFFEEVGRSPGVERALVGIGEAVEATGTATAPEDTGDYKSRFRVEVRRGPGRTVVRVVNDDPAALAIEARHGTLQRAGRSVRR